MASSVFFFFLKSANRFIGDTDRNGVVVTYEHSFRALLWSPVFEAGLMGEWMFLRRFRLALSGL